MPPTTGAEPPSVDFLVWSLTLALLVPYIFALHKHDVFLIRLVTKGAASTLFLYHAIHCVCSMWMGLVFFGAAHVGYILSFILCGIHVKYLVMSAVIPIVFASGVLHLTSREGHAAHTT